MIKRTKNRFSFLLTKIMYNVKIKNKERVDIMDLNDYSNSKHAKIWMDKIKDKKNDKYDPLITYLFINKNLNMTAGKIAAQSARVGQIMLLNELKYEDSLLLTSINELFEDDFMKGNKTIALKANQNQLERLLYGDLKQTLDTISQENNIPIRLYPTFDIGATEVEINSLTMISMTPVKRSIINKFTRKFQLYS